MTLGLWLLVVGVCDLLRAARDTTSTRRRAALAVTGCALLAAAGLAVGFTGPWWWGVAPLWMLTLVGWIVFSSIALDPRSTRPGRWRGLAFATLLVAVVALTVLWDSAPHPLVAPVGWDDSLLGKVGPTRLLLLVGVAVFELSTANIVVRLLLDATGVPAASNENELAGGRLLGPMERTFILVLALAGQLTAATVVVAAKGLLRYPELRRARDEGPTAVSEYILIGSFASWLLGVLGWLLTRR